MRLWYLFTKLNHSSCAFKTLLSTNNSQVRYVRYIHSVNFRYLVFYKYFQYYSLLIYFFSAFSTKFTYCCYCRLSLGSRHSWQGHPSAALAMLQDKNGRWWWWCTGVSAINQHHWPASNSCRWHFQLNNTHLSGRLGQWLQLELELHCYALSGAG